MTETAGATVIRNAENMATETVEGTVTETGESTGSTKSGIKWMKDWDLISE